MFFLVKEMIRIKNRRFITVVIIVISLICLIFLFNAYKNLKFGNNEINKSAEEIKNYIMNINSYEATIEVTVNSNKNTNKYILKQEYLRNNSMKQTVIKPENIAGIELEYKDGNLIIKNTRFNLSKICNEYPYVSDNVLWLSSFSDYLKNNINQAKVFEQNNEIVIEINQKQNAYFATRRLYLEKGTGKPKRMEVIDENKNTSMYILYNEININK